MKPLAAADAGPARQVVSRGACALSPIAHDTSTRSRNWQEPSVAALAPAALFAQSVRSHAARALVETRLCARTCDGTALARTIR
jgi:hypothetical protein